MREIKFRTWDSRQMHDWDFCCHQFLMPGLHGKTSGWKWMQYIGIKAKDGKEVYEGDIIIFDNSAIGGKRITGEVVFNADRTLSNLEYGLWCNGYHPIDFLGEIEIIGNIFEDPSLLLV
jgi:hypothetical protein